MANAAAALGKVGVEVSSKVLGQFVGKDGAKISETVAQLEVSSSNNIKTVVTTGDLPNNSIADVRAISADQANAPFVARGWNPPYDTGSQVRTFTTTADIKFARVSTVDNPQGAFLVRVDEIAGMTPLQIQQHLALPKIPTQIADVTVPAGTNMQVGRVAAQPAFGANTKGGIQYQLLGQIPSSSFGVPRAL